MTLDLFNTIPRFMKMCTKRVSLLTTIVPPMITKQDYIPIDLVALLHLPKQTLHLGYAKNAKRVLRA